MARQIMTFPRSIRGCPFPKNTSYPAMHSDCAMYSVHLQLHYPSNHDISEGHCPEIQVWMTSIILEFVHKHRPRCVIQSIDVIRGIRTAIKQAWKNQSRISLQIQLLIIRRKFEKNLNKRAFQVMKEIPAWVLRNPS